MAATLSLDPRPHFLTGIQSDLDKRIQRTRDSLILFFGSWAFFIWNLSHPKTRNFDEFHYIPSALQWLGLKENQNWEHPPLAKLLIAVGVGLFGDEPIGWRIMATLFGALTLVGMYRLALALFNDDRRAGWICVLLTLFNQLLYVQARIAMLDTFMVAFLVWALWAYTRALDSKVFHPGYARLGAVFMGFAIACKWFAIVPWLMILGLMFLQALRLKSRARFQDLLVYGILLPATCYFATFLPYLLIEKEPPHTFWSIFTDMQTRMLDGQRRVVNPHPYNSTWIEWILMKRPIWYAFDREGEKNELVRGVLLLGNPVIMWGGLVAIAGAAIYGVIESLKKKSIETSWSALWIVYFWLGMATCWIVVPRKVAFYYYYYPAAMMLSLALTYWLVKLKKSPLVWIFIGIVCGVFIYFFPILGALPIRGDSFTRWMWLRSWI